MNTTTKLSVIFNIPDNVKTKILELQEEITKEFNNIIKKEEKFHITLIISDNINLDDVDEIKEQLKKLLADVSLNITVGPIETMVNHKGEGIVYLQAGNEELAKLHKAAKQILSDHGGKYVYDGFKAHVTLVYLDKPATEDDHTVLDNFEFNESVKMSVSNANISIKENDEWKKIALLQLSKRRLNE